MDSFFITFMTALCLINFYMPEAATVGGDRSRISSGFGKRLTDRFSSRSNSRYSIRYYRQYNGYGSAYKTDMATLNKSRMGGITTNKQALLIAGSVYIAANMRPVLYYSSGGVISNSVDEFAICSGWVSWNKLYRNGSYAMPGNGTDAILNATGASVSLFGNVTAASNTSAAIVLLRYFLCPNDLIDSIFEGDDTYCCGPPAGIQMCCSQEDFYEQAKDSGVGDILTIVAIVAVAVIVLPFVICSKRVRALLCRRSPANTAVIFSPVATSETPVVTFATPKDSAQQPQLQLEPSAPMYLQAPVDLQQQPEEPLAPPPPYPGF